MHLNKRIATAALALSAGASFAWTPSWSQIGAMWAGFAGAGGALGPIVSGALLESFWWGSAFLVNVPVIACCTAFTSVEMRERISPVLVEV